MYIQWRNQPIGREEGMLANGKRSAEALRPGPTTAFSLFLVQLVKHVKQLELVKLVKL